MDAVEKWLVDQAHELPEGEGRDAVLLVASRYHYEGPREAADEIKRLRQVITTAYYSRDEDCIDALEAEIT